MRLRCIGPCGRSPRAPGPARRGRGRRTPTAGARTARRRPGRSTHDTPAPSALDDVRDGLVPTVQPALLRCSRFLPATTSSGDRRSTAALRQSVRAAFHNAGTPGSDNIGQCCGTASVGELALDRYQATGDEQWLTWADTLADDVMSRAIDQRVRVRLVEHRAHRRPARADTGARLHAGRCWHRGVSLTPRPGPQIRGRCTAGRVAGPGLSSRVRRRTGSASSWSGGRPGRYPGTAAPSAAAP